MLIARLPLSLFVMCVCVRVYDSRSPSRSLNCQISLRTANHTNKHTINIKTTFYVAKSYDLKNKHAQRAIGQHYSNVIPNEHFYGVCVCECVSVSNTDMHDQIVY